MGENTKKWFKLLILLFLILSVFLFKKENQEKILDLISSFSFGSDEKTLMLTESFPNNNILDINIYNDNVIMWQDNKLSFLKTNGELILEKEFNFSNSSIHYGERNIYPFDKSTGDIYFLNKDGETVDRLQLGKEIFNIKEIKENLICHSKIENKEKIDILDKNRVLIGSPLFENKSILAYDINKSGNKILVSLLDLNDNILKSKINYYGQNNERLSSLHIEGEIVLFNELIDDDTVIVLTDKSLYYIKSKKIIWKKEFNLIKDIYLGDKIYILYSNYLETIDLEGETIEKIGFTKDYNNIMDFKGNTILYGDENLAMVKDGELILEHEESILKVCTNKSQILILGPDEINIYKLMNKE